MSATQYVWVEGTAKWARIYPHNMDTKFGDKFTISLYVDEKNINTLKEVGYRAKFREDEDGTFIKLVRDNTKQFSNGLQTLGPPKVKNAKGTEDFTETIGNGSKVAVLLEIFPSKYGIASRMNEVRVLNHVAYVPPVEGATPGLPTG